MGEAIQDGARQALVVEDLIPLLERQVRGDDDACSLIGLTDHIEQEFRAELARRDVAELVDLCVAQHKSTYVE